MLDREEILEIIKIRRSSNGNLVPRTEEFIKKNKELVDSIMLLTQTITNNPTLCDRIHYISRELYTNHTCVCGKEIPLIRTHCSPKCSSNDIKVREKYKTTCINTYGVDNVSKTNEIKQNISEKNRSNYVERKEEILAKRYKTNLKTFGTSGALGNVEQQLKYQETSQKRFGVDNIFSSIQFKTRLKHHKSKTSANTFKYNFNKGLLHCNTSIPLFSENDWDLDIHKRKFKCLTCGDEYYQYSRYVKRCIKCYPLKKTNAEIEIVDLLNSNNISNIGNSRKIIPPFELDVYLPDNKLAIEYNGLIFHSYGYGSNSLTNNSDKENINRHLHKTNLCKSQNIQLLHIFENEWLDTTKRNIWESIIKSKIGVNSSIGARKCIIKEVSFLESKNFLNNNHLQGNSQSSIRLGLYHPSEGLVSLLTFIKSRFNKNYEWEITRYCNKLEFNIIGGFSKLLSNFRKNNEGSIITYADKRYSTGDMYLKSGFTELKDSTPNYFYFTDSEYVLHSRIKFQKHKLKDLLPIFDESKSESENMFTNGYRRIWDCGNKVFVLYK